MDNISKKPLEEEDHDLPPSDETLRNKIDKHLSDKEDTISEEDMKKINTSTGRENIVAVPHREKDEQDEINDDEKDKDDIEPDKEAPSSWEILGH